MREIGDLLRKARQARGLTIEDVQEATKIRARYLEAMEEGEFDALPGEVYVKGFLRNYAECVGLSGEELVAQYKARLSKREAEKAKESELPVRRKSVAKKFRIGRRLTLSAVLACVVLLVVAVLTWQSRNVPLRGPGVPGEVRDGEEDLGKNLPNAADEVIPEGPPPQSGVATDTTVTGEVTSTGAGQEAQDGAALPSYEGQELSVVVSERCWVRVVADGKIVFERSMLAGESATWRAKKTIRIKVGNASGIDVTLNGVHIGKLGESGEVLERSFPES